MGYIVYARIVDNTSVDNPSISCGPVGSNSMYLYDPTRGDSRSDETFFVRLQLGLFYNDVLQAIEFMLLVEIGLPTFKHT